MKSSGPGALHQARRRLSCRLDDPALLSREDLSTLAATGAEALVLVPLALARLFQPCWEKVSSSPLVGDLVRATEGWLTRRGDEQRMKAAALARLRARWEEELGLVRPSARRSLHRWKHWGRKIPHAPRDQFPLDALLAEKFARLAAGAAGALTSTVAGKAAEETLRALEGDSRSSPGFAGVGRPLVDAAVRDSLRAWVSGRSHVGRPGRPWKLEDNRAAWLAHMRTFERYDPRVGQSQWLELDEHDDREAWLSSGRSSRSFPAWRRSRLAAVSARIPADLDYGARMEMWWDLYRADRLERTAPPTATGRPKKPAAKRRRATSRPRSRSGPA